MKGETVTGTPLPPPFEGEVDARKRGGWGGPGSKDNRRHGVCRLPPSLTLPLKGEGK